LALQGNPATQHCAKLSHNGQAQPGAAILQASIRLGLSKGLKYPVLLCLGHANTGISHRDDQCAFCHVRGNRNLAVLGEFAGVGEQVGHNLLQFSAIAIHIAHAVFINVQREAIIVLQE
tara:strand:+ start:394 stop:750 length:357 start_codon:yes stop_codon:yes gene_type:complete